MKQAKEFFAFIKERERVRERKEAGRPRPWSKDPILQHYRFCNIHREDDKVTIWIRENWREPHMDDPNLWFAMVVARLLNRPESMEESGYPVPWKPAKWVKTLDARKAGGERVFSAAYMIHADRHAGGSKIAYLSEQVLTPLWKERKAGYEAFTSSLIRAHTWLMGFRDMGSFMAGQVVADVKYTTLLQNAPDWWTWAAPGPGSLKGMSQVEFGDLNTKYSDRDWQESLAMLKHKIDPMLYKAGMSPMHAQDLQNCLCEFSKYTRGYGKQKYDGAKPS